MSADLVMSDTFVHQMHGFYMNKEQKEMSFDVVVSFEPKDRHKVFTEAVNRVKEKYPDYSINANMDSDYNEL